MSEYSDRYRQRISKGTDGSARSIRMKQAKDTYNRNFKDIYTFVGRYNFESIDKCFCATGKRLEKLAAFYSDTVVIKL